MDDIPATSPTTAPTAPRRLIILLAVTAALVVTTDQLTKTWAVRALTVGDPVDVVGGALRLDLTRNSGAAFSLATGMTWVLTLIATAAAVVIVRVARKLGTAWWALALGLLLGGALGNLWDRFFRAPGFARGHVVDFLELPHCPVFNVADSCIVTSAVLIALLGVRGIGLDGTRTPGARDGA